MPIEILSSVWVKALFLFLLTLFALLVIKSVAIRQMHRLALNSRLAIFSFAEHIVAATRLPFIFWAALLAGVSQLTVSEQQDQWLQYAWIIIVVSQVALWIDRFITVAVERATERNRETDPAGATHLMLAGLIGRLVLWSIALLVTLDNLGFNITTLMASLGIGGIAVALATQNILGDVFSSISIALDKPFVIGDFIIVDEYLGTVEYVGLKTTRIRSLGGEQIVFSNTELLKARIRNYKRMQERRVLFGFGLAHETATEQIEAVPTIVRTIIESQPELARFDRAHFKAVCENSLDFEVVYYMLTPDFNRYMDMQQIINLELVSQLREKGIRFAHPIRMLHAVPHSALAPEPDVEIYPSTQAQ